MARMTEKKKRIYFNDIYVFMAFCLTNNYFYGFDVLDITRLIVQGSGSIFQRSNSQVSQTVVISYTLYACDLKAKG